MKESQLIKNYKLPSLHKKQEQKRLKENTSKILNLNTKKPQKNSVQKSNLPLLKY